MRGKPSLRFPCNKKEGKVTNRYKPKWKKLNKQCSSVKETKCRHTSRLEPHGWQCWKPNFFLAHLGTGHHLFFHSLPASDNSRGSQGMRQAGDWPQRSLSGRVLVVSFHHFNFTRLFFISINTWDLFFSALILLHSFTHRKESTGCKASRTKGKN